MNDEHAMQHWDSYQDERYSVRLRNDVELLSVVSAEYCDSPPTPRLR